MERIVWVIYRAKAENSLIQFMARKNGCVAFMGEAAEQNAVDVWRHLSDTQCFAMHFVKQVIAFSRFMKCSKGLFFCARFSITSVNLS